MEKNDGNSREPRTPLWVILALVLAFCVGINIGYLVGKGFEADDIFDWFKSLASGKDPRAGLVIREAESFLMQS